ncbi:MAG: EamA family transporter, partial [Gemmatimonadales bacterium]
MCATIQKFLISAWDIAEIYLPDMPNSPINSSGSPRRMSPAVAMLLVCLIWGINFSMMKFALRSLTPYALTTIRFTVASLVLWLVARALEPDTPLSWRLRLRLAGLGVIGNSFYQLGFLVGLERTTAGNSSLLVATTPLAIAVLGSALG